MTIHFRRIAKKTLASMLCVLMMFSTLFVGSISSASALTCTGGYIYFDASGWDTTTNSKVQFVIGHSSYSSTYTMTKLNNTSLYYYQMLDWNGATYIAFMANPTAWGSGDWSTSNLRNAACYTGTINYDLYSGSTYLFTKSSTASKGAALTGNYYSAGYSAINHTQTTDVQVSENGTSYSKAITSPADIRISSYKLSSRNATAASTSTIANGSTAVTNSNVMAAYSASVSYSVSNVDPGYEFVGWYNGNTQLSASTSYTRTNISSANTVTARFKKLSYNVVISAGTGGTVSPSGTKSVGADGITVSATPNTGYTFSNWSVTGGAHVNNSTFNPVTLTATNTGTLTANFAKTAYSITYEPGDNFTYSNNQTNATYGDKVSFTITPESGYKIFNVTAKNASGAKITVTDDGNNNYSFSMPASNVTVSAEAVLDIDPLPVPVITGNNLPSGGLFVEQGSNVAIAITNATDFPVGTTFKFTLDGNDYDLEDGIIKTNDLSIGTHTLGVRAFCEGYSDSTAEYAFTVTTAKRTVTVSSANSVVSQLEVSYMKNGSPFSKTIENVVTGEEITVDKGTKVTVTAVLPKDADGVEIASVKKWTVNGEDFASTDSTYTFEANDNTSVEVTAYAIINVDDYTIGNTWVKPDETTNVTVVMKKSHDQLGASASYNAKVFGLDAEGKTVFSSPLSASVNEDAQGTKVTFEPVEISYNVEGVYEIAAAIFGYDAQGNQIAYGYLADPDRILTISNEPAKVSLTARLTATTDSGVVIEEGASGDIIQGETVTLNGYCNNGNKPAGEYAENTATSYQYDYYYYTDDVDSPNYITTVVDNEVNFTGKPVTQTTTTFTVPEDAEPGTEYHFFVEITALLDGNPISDPCSSLSKGAVTGIVVEPKVMTPQWAEGYVYFHTIGDNITDSQAWTSMEEYNSTKDGTISVGTYRSSSTHQVFLPENAKNSDNTYLVYNNYSAPVTFTKGGNKKITVENGTTANIPADVDGLYLGESTHLAPLKIYTSNAEENVYVNTGADTKDASGKAVNTVSGLVSALCFDKAGGTKADAVVTKPDITLVQSDGTIDTSEAGSKQIKGRGNSTWTGTKKKSFNFTLNSKVKVNGMSKLKKYSLLANYQDPSLARNRFMLDLADSVGVPYASDSRFADVYVNGLYAGSYLLTQKYDAIEEDLTDDPSEPGAIVFDESGNVTDMDFMIELACDSQGDDLEIKPYTGTTGDGILSVTLPDPGDLDDAITSEILPAGSKAKVVNFIKSKYETLYTALSNSKTTKEQLEALIDVDSLAKVYLINEISKNYDAGVSSFYLSYVDGKFKASPVWDFDNALGNVNVTPSEAPDYKQPSGWWCKYWRGNSNKYTKNLVNAAAKSDIVMEAAKAAWFGKDSQDTTSFVYNLNKFSADPSTSADLSANSGLQTKTYYLSVLQKSAENNFRKWSIVPNDWVSGHDNLTMYTLDYNTLLNMVDYNTYSLAEAYTPDSDAFTNTLTKSSRHYTQSAITSTSTRNGGQYEFSADYMSSRASWITYNFLAGTSYYLSGDFNAWTTQADDNYRLVEIEPGSGIYAIRNIDRSLVCGTDVYFKLNNGSAYIGPEENTDLSEAYVHNGRAAYKTTGTVVDTEAYASLTAKNVPASWTKVNVYYQPSTKSVWIAQYVADKYSKPTVTLVTDETEVEYNSEVILTASAAGITVSVDGSTASDYTGEYVYEFYRMLGEEPAPENDKLIKSVTTSENTCEATVRVKDIYKYYVVVYPAVDSTASSTSEVLTVDGGVEEKSVEIPLYIDFANAEVSEVPVVTTVNNAGKTTEYTLSKLGESNIYSSTVNFAYLLGLNDKVYDNFDIQKIKIGDIEIALTDNSQPQADKIINAGDSKAIWLKANTDTLTTNYEDFTYTIDETLKLEGITDTPVETNKSVSSTTKRIYFSDNVWKNGTPYIYHDRMSDWDSSQLMHYASTNMYGEDIYYYDVPSNATVVVFRSHDKLSQSTDVNFNSSVTSSTNNHYYLYGKYYDKDVAVATNAAAPQISSYVSDIYLSVGTKDDITPDAPSGLTYTCTSASSSIVSVSSTDGCVITGKSAGTTTVTITPKGSNGDNGTAVKTTIHVVDKTTLNNYLANAKKIIDEEEGNSVYTDLTYDDVVNAYTEGLEVYQTSYDTKAISESVAQLKAAFDQLEKAPTEDEFDLISYTTAVVTVKSDGNGTVSNPETCGYVQEAENGYTVTYAANDGTKDFTYSLSSTAAASEGYEFTGWMTGEDLSQENTELSITEAPTQDVVYTAAFVSTNTDETIPE